MSQREDEVLARVRDPDPPSRLSPGGLAPLQARILGQFRTPLDQGVIGNAVGPRRGELTAGDELSGFDRAVGRFSGGVADELTLGRGGAIGGLDRDESRTLNRPGLDVGDFADVTGRIVGALPLALVTGGLANMGAKVVAGKLATTAPRVAQAIGALAGDVPQKASLGLRILGSSPSRNVFEGLAYSAVAGPARKLEETQTRGRAIAEEIGVGAAADFILGAVMGSGGAAFRRVAQAMGESDNSIDREIAGLLTEALDQADNGGNPLDVTRRADQANVREAEIVDEEGLDVPLLEQSTSGPPPFQRARFRGEVVEEAGIGAFGTDAGEIVAGPSTGRIEGSTVLDTESPVAGLIPGETGGPRLAGGETLTREQALLRDDVDVDRNRPFLSRRQELEATEAVESPVRAADPEQPQLDLGAEIAAEAPGTARPQGESDDLPFIEGTEQFAAPQGDSFGFDVEVNGQTASVAGSFDAETGVVTIGNIQGGRGEFGTGGMRQVLREVRRRFPEATKVEGTRTTEGGITQGKEVSRSLRREAEVEAESPAPRETELSSEPDLPTPRSREGQDLVERIAAADSEAALFTAASDLASTRLSTQERQAVADLIARRREALAGGRGSPEPVPFSGRAPEEQALRDRLAGRLRQQRARTQAKAKTDKLTGLANRQGDIEESNRALKQIERSEGTAAARVVSDLNNFKALNDELGPAVGDEALEAVGKAFRSALRPEDVAVAARSGGDEFNALLRVVDEADDAAVTTRVEEAVNAALEPFNARLKESGSDERVSFSALVARAQEGENVQAIDTRLNDELKARKKEAGSTGLEGRRAREAGLQEGPRFKRQPGTPEALPEPDATVPAAVARLGFTENPQPLTRSVDQLGEERIVDIAESTAVVRRSVDQSDELAATAFSGRLTNGKLAEIQEQQAIGDESLRAVALQYGPDVADQIAENSGAMPLSHDPTLPGARIAEPVDASAVNYVPGERVALVEGEPSQIRVAGQDNLRVKWAVADLDDLHASHLPDTWQPNPEYYPTNSVQQRDYLNNTAARDAVVSIATKPDLESFVDPSGFAQVGPATVTPDGRAIAGNSRLMALKRMSAKQRTAYRELLAERAADLGIKGDLPENGVLVRVLDDPTLDYGDLNQMRALNIDFDRALGKSKSTVEDAASRAAVMRQKGGAASRHLEETISPDQTLRQYLATKPGRKFVQLLRNADVIGEAEVGRFVDSKSGDLTEDGKSMVTDTMLMAAINDVDAVRNAPPSISNKLEHAIPSMLRTKDTDFDVGPTVREALEIHADIAENQAFTGRTGKVAEFRTQGDVFGQRQSDAALDMAEFIEDNSKREVTEAFRTLGREMDVSLKQNESQDLFGFEPKTPDEVISEQFGNARRIRASKRKPCQ